LATLKIRNFEWGFEGSSYNKHVKTHNCSLSELGLEDADGEEASKFFPTIKAH
jgi:hypothetical protein